MSSDQVYNGTPLLGPLKEHEVLQPVNVYGQHKLEAEQRALRNNPNAVGLRLTWMYDVPNSSMKLNSNIMVNLQKAYNEGTTLKAATHEFRGVTNVWEVVKFMQQALNLPGGIYNFGSGNTLNSYLLHLEFAKKMGLENPERWILPDEERFCEQPRNLVMDCSLVEGFGIRFSDI